MLKRRRLYDDGTENVYFQVFGGKGFCEIIDAETNPTFECIHFKLDLNYDHVVTDKITGEPWQHWKMGPCPDCQGRGSGLEGGACRRCAGIGKVRHYEDGHIGEERTRRHPKEPEQVTEVDPGTILTPVEKPNVL